ncbi:insulinase family protein [Burkholderiaceae bacterium FT117]|uniref:M16 family metallopeptidase n=1 Tax=Zeimonas sediminis TaxID=2944268 RepID=UPI0023432076|nr:pitrilysin family protein [Zeimonas sediminis]MCM5571711.1 insulinase family protein [Zeimonas sediminis]
MLKTILRMRARVLAALALALLAGAAQAALPIQHWTASSGARVYFVRADAIPMLDLSVEFDAGGRYDPAGKTGLASLTNAMLARGTDGDRPMGEAEIAERFARIGAQRGGGAGDDRAGVSLRTLTGKAELDESVSLLARILAAPSFPEAVLERERQRWILSIREAGTKPETIARRSFGELLYGDHPYGREAAEATVAAIAREDLVRFHRDHYDARRAVVAMIGAITREQAEAIAERLTKDLPAGADRPGLPKVRRLGEAVERRIAHPASQSHILIGAPAIERGHPDFFPLFVGNYVLGGGGFVSRLYSEVREKRGLAYSVYSYFSPQLQPGPFTIGLQTQKAQTGEALKVVRETLERFVREGPTEKELAAAKDNLVGGFALRIDSNRKILDNLAMIGFYRLPLDYLERWTDRVSAVTLEQVRDAFARNVDPAALATVVVGDGEPGPR